MVAAKIANMSEGRHSATRSIDLVAQDAAAEMLNVSVPSVKRAKKVQESGDASLIADVESGKVTVSAAAPLFPVRAFINHPSASLIC
jgi:glycine cleavage system H lipoate-binding protein